MIYLPPSAIKGDFIGDILRIDASTFELSLQGTDESVRARYNANRESFVLAYDDAEIVGYVAFFPITANLSGRIEKEYASFDDNIEDDDILPSYDNPFEYNVFLISIAVLPEYKGKGIGATLMKEYFKFIGNKLQAGCRIKKTYSYAYTDDGTRVLSKMGFVEIKRIEDPEMQSVAKLMQYDF